MAGNEELAFDAGLIAEESHKLIPEDLVLRPLASGDYKRGHLEVLKVLTTVTDPGEDAWLARFDAMRNAKPQAYFPIAIIDKKSNKIVALGTVILELKFIRGLASCAHIEDIAVDKSMQGKGLGKKVILVLMGIANKLGTYKTILDCSPENQGFYEKCGFKLAGVEMAAYAPKKE